MNLEREVELARYTTFNVGGLAEYFARVQSEQELLEALAYARERNLPVFVFGGGSNLLVSERGIRGLVIKNEIKGISWNDSAVRVGAGEVWDELVTETIERGLWGLENLSGIPGTVGGAPVQNIGAYGVEAKETITSVETYDMRTLEKKVFSNAECGFAYRESFFKTAEGKQYIITAVTFSLAKSGTPKINYKDLQTHFKDNPSPSLSEIREAVLNIRSQKFPDLREVGTAGSFFKNPIISGEKYEELKEQYPDLPGFPAASMIKIPLAWILENVLHKKGHREGDVALFERQPLVLVNYGKATPAEIEKFAQSIEQEVFEKTGIHVEREVNCIK